MRKREREREREGEREERIEWKLAMWRPYVVSGALPKPSDLAMDSLRHGCEVPFFGCSNSRSRRMSEEKLVVWASGWEWRNEWDGWMVGGRTHVQPVSLLLACLRKGGNRAAQQADAYLFMHASSGQASRPVIPPPSPPPPPPPRHIVPPSNGISRTNPKHSTATTNATATSNPVHQPHQQHPPSD